MPNARVAVPALLMLVGLLTGCASMPYSLGYRPAEPRAPGATTSSCDDYRTYEAYALNLQEAYHSRSSQNRGWLYVAGILGLGVAAASGGLAAASAAAVGTLALLSISGAFAAGSFATISNEALALSYTVAANSVDQSLKSSREMLVKPPGRNDYTDSSCAGALNNLYGGVSNARAHLEVARTDNAAGAMARAKDQLKLLSEQVAAAEALDPTRMTVTAEIENLVSVPAPPNAAAAAVVTLKVKNFRGDTVPIGALSVVLDAAHSVPVSTLSRDPANPNTYLIEFTVPANTLTSGTPYKPRLLVSDRYYVGSKNNSVTLQY